MQFLRQTIRHYYVLLFPIVLWLLVWVYWQLASLSFDGIRIYYGLILFRKATNLYLIPASLIDFLIVLLIALAIKSRLSRRQEAIYALALILVFVAIPFSFIVNFENFAEFGTSFNHEDRISLDPYLYQLAHSRSYGNSKSSYYLYRCDSIGFVCDRIGQLDTSRGTKFESLGNYGPVNRARLVIDAATGHVSIQIGNEILYTDTSD